MIQAYNLPVANPAIEAFLNASVKCRAYTSNEVRDWQAILKDPSRHPLGKMRKQTQRWNDCQGQSLCNGEEWRRIFHFGNTEQLSDSDAYACSELIDTGRVGGDNGSTIGAGVTLLTKGVTRFGIKPGLVLESQSPYQRATNTNQFVQQAKSIPRQDVLLAEHGQVPRFQDMLPTFALGASVHLGIMWPGQNDRVWGRANNRRVLTAPTRSGLGGHAVEAIWADEVNGEWLILVWNSHGDEFFYMNESCWNIFAGNQFAPFGGWLLLADQAMSRYLTATEISGSTWT